MKLTCRIVRLDYEQMVQYYLGDGRKHLEIAKAYNNIYETPSIKEDEAKWSKYLKLIVLYIVLAEYNNEQSDFINRLAKDPNLIKLPVYEQLVGALLTNEVMNKQVVFSKYQPELATLLPFSDSDEAKKLWDDLALRIIEHNIRVIERYYTRISVKRLCELLTLAPAEVETYVSKLVVKGSIWAKIDRPAGIVVFKKTEHPSDTLNKWNSDIDQLLKIVENTCHLIQRENMVHKAKQQKS